MAQQAPSTIHHSQRTPPVLSSVWRRVDQLDDGGESDVEWEDDEVYSLTLDFGSLVSIEAFEQDDSFQLLEETAIKPLARVGAQIFQGRHEELIGAELFFHPPKNEQSDYDPVPPQPHQSRITFEPVTVLSPEEAARRRTRGRKAAAKPPADPSTPKRGPGRPKGSKNKPKPPGWVKPPTATKPKVRKKSTEAASEGSEASHTSVRRSSRPAKPSAKRAVGDASSAVDSQASQPNSEQSVASESGVNGIGRGGN